METREEISNDIYELRQLGSVTEQIISWNFEDLHGIGFRKAHDKYAHIEISISRVTETFANSSLEWAVPAELFSRYHRQYGKDFLKKYIGFLPIT